MKSTALEVVINWAKPDPKIEIINLDIDKPDNRDSKSFSETQLQSDSSSLETSLWTVFKLKNGEEQQFTQKKGYIKVSKLFSSLITLITI